MKRRAFVISVALHALLLVTVYVFQGMIFPYIRIYGLVPLLLPIVCAGVAVYEGCHAGGITGLFAGILCDVSFNQPVGVFTIILTLAGLFFGALADAVLTRGFVTYLLLCIAILFISSFAQIFPFLFFAGHSQVPLLTVTLWQTLYSWLFAVPIWFFVRALGKRAQDASSREKPL